MKKIVLVLVSLVSLFFISCTSVSFAGEGSVERNNLSNEYFNIAKVYEEQKNYTKAIEFYTKAKSNKELVRTCDYKIGLCYVYSKDWENAKTSFEKLLKLDSENGSLKSSLAYIKAMSGDLDGALEIYKELFEANNTDVTFLKNYISILIAKKDVEAAKTQLDYLKENFKTEDSIESFEKAIKKLEDEAKKESEDKDKKGKKASKKAAKKSSGNSEPSESKEISDPASDSSTEAAGEN